MISSRFSDEEQLNACGEYRLAARRGRRAAGAVNGDPAADRPAARAARAADVTGAQRNDGAGNPGKRYAPGLPERAEGNQLGVRNGLPVTKRATTPPAGLPVDERAAGEQHQAQRLRLSGESRFRKVITQARHYIWAHPSPQPRYAMRCRS